LIYTMPVKRIKVQKAATALQRWFAPGYQKSCTLPHLRTENGVSPCKYCVSSYFLRSKLLPIRL